MPTTPLRRQRAWRRAAAIAVAAASALAVAGCGAAQGLRFTQDDRLRFTAPANEANVSLPLTVSWQISDFTVRPPGSPPRDNTGYFAVFVDGYPVPPGQPLTDALPTGYCVGQRNCPSPAQLASQAHVYVTDKTAVTISTLGDGNFKTSNHYVVIVLVDGAGRRQGDSFWYRSFNVSGADRHRWDP
jgi:hypothetical protein